MDNVERIKFALQHHMDKSIAEFSKGDWERLILSSGEPTKLEEVPYPLSSVMTDAKVVAVTASGIINPDPGIDIVRYDAQDAPHVYNIDHYSVVENLPNHADYSKVLSTANVKETDELNKILKEKVFVVGPRQSSDHWVKELPERIRNAKQKNKP